MVETKNSICNTPMIRGTCEFAHDIITVFRAYSDFDQRRLCNPNLDSIEFSAQFGSNFVQVAEKYSDLPNIMELNLLYNYEKNDSIVGVYFTTESTPAVPHKLFGGFKIYKPRNTSKTVLKLYLDSNFGFTVLHHTSEQIIRSHVDGLLILKERIGDWVRKNGEKNFSEKLIY